MNKKPLLALAGLALVILVGGWFTLQSRVLYVTSVSPKDKSAGSSQQVIQINFNKQLAQTTADSFYTEPSVKGQVTVEGSKLTFKPSGIFEFGKTYTFGIHSALAADGTTKDDIVYTFNSKYLPLSKVDKATQEHFQDQTDRSERVSPLARNLPYETTHFRITHQAGANNTISYTISLLAILNRASQKAQYEQNLITYKQEAWDYIRSKGEDPASLNINYLPYNPSP